MVLINQHNFYPTINSEKGDRMKKILFSSLIFAVVMTFGLTNAFAATAKATAKIGDLSTFSASPDNAAEFQEIFRQNIHTAQAKDLFIDVSLECGLTTDTKAMSRLLDKATATAEAVVKVRVKVDGKLVRVNNIDDAIDTPENTEITFARRQQTLIAEFAGDITDCITEEGTIDLTDETCVQEETLELILDTMQANSFNFIKPDLNAGDHDVTVEAKLSYVAADGEYQAIIDSELSALTEAESAAARAYLGNGSVTIEAVRMIKDEILEID